MYIESVYAGQTIADFLLPEVTKMNIIGGPLPVVNSGPNKSLQLIGFSTDIDNGPVTVDANGRVAPSYPWLEHRIKWRVSSKCTIGFYTPNYLTDVTQEQSVRSVLLINDKGPSIFTGRCGCFTTSYIGPLFIITDKKVTVELLIQVRTPNPISFPSLELFRPLPYRLPNGCVYAYETKVSDVNRDLTFIPARGCITLAAVMKDFLIATSVLLDFSPIVQIAPSLKMLGNNEPLKLKNVNMKRYDSSSGGGPGVDPDVEFIFYLDLTSVKGVINKAEGYGTPAVGTTYPRLQFPVVTDGSKLSRADIRYEFSVTNYPIPDPKPNVWPPTQGQRIGYTEGRFYDYETFNKKPQRPDYDGTTTLIGSGTLTIDRSCNFFELQISLNGFSDSTSVMTLTTLEVSFFDPKAPNSP